MSASDPAGDPAAERIAALKLKLIKEKIAAQKRLAETPAPAVVTPPAQHTTPPPALSAPPPGHLPPLAPAPSPMHPPMGHMPGMPVAPPFYASPDRRLQASIMQRRLLERKLSALKKKDSSTEVVGKLETVLERLARMDEAEEGSGSGKKTTMDLLAEQNLMMQNMMMQQMMARHQASQGGGGRRRRRRKRPSSGERFSLAQMQLQMQQQQLNNERNMFQQQQLLQAVSGGVVGSAGAGVVPGVGAIMPGAVPPVLQGGLVPPQPYNPNDPNGMPINPLNYGNPNEFNEWMRMHGQIAGPNGYYDPAGQYMGPGQAGYGPDGGGGIMGDDAGELRARGLRGVKRAMIVVWFCVYIQSYAVLRRKLRKDAITKLKNDIVLAVPETIAWLKKGLGDIILGVVNYKKELYVRPANVKNKLSKKQRRVIADLGALLEATCEMLANPAATGSMADITKSVIHDLTKEQAVYPRGFLMPIEEEYLEFDRVSRSHDMALQRRRLVAANFLLTRSLIAEIVLFPSRHGFAVDSSDKVQMAQYKAAKRNKRKGQLLPAILSEVVVTNCKVFAYFMYYITRSAVGENGEPPVDPEEALIQQLPPDHAMAVAMTAFQSDGSLDRWAQNVRDFCDNVLKAILVELGEAETERPLTDATGVGLDVVVQSPGGSRVVKHTSQHHLAASTARSRHTGPGPVAGVGSHASARASGASVLVPADSPAPAASVAAPTAHTMATGAGATTAVTSGEAAPNPASVAAPTAGSRRTAKNVTPAPQFTSVSSRRRSGPGGAGSVSGGGGSGGSSGGRTKASQRSQARSTLAPQATPHPRASGSGRASQEARPVSRVSSSRVSLRSNRD